MVAVGEVVSPYKIISFSVFIYFILVHTLYKTSNFVTVFVMLVKKTPTIELILAALSLPISYLNRIFVL